MPETSYKPLRIRAYLQSGVISDQYLPIDAVLYYHAVRQKYGVQDVTEPGRGNHWVYGGVELPIQHNYEPGKRDWYYSASFAQWPGHTVEDAQHYTKRFDLKQSDFIDFKNKAGKVETARGHYKGLFNRVYYRHALYIDWYVVGDGKQLTELLRFCLHLGKKPSQGYGVVLRWEVIEWPADWSTYGPDGRIMRALPSDEGPLYGIRPSYWLGEHQFTCQLPA